MKCPNCGSDSNGAFCADCGAPLKGAKCRECNTPLQPGSKFCTACGASVGGRAAAASSKVPWLVAAGALLVFLVVLLWPKISGRENTQNDGRVPIGQMEGVQSVGAPGSESNGGPNPEQLSGSPREQADRLFNRIMTAKENGDTANAKFFLPMGVQAYEMVENIDADGLYHLSLLQDFGGDYKAARATADKILATDPTHLLALSSAALASAHAGDKAAAKKYAQTFMSSYDSEIKKQKQEYLDHEKVFPELKQQMQMMR